MWDAQSQIQMTMSLFPMNQGDCKEVMSATKESISQKEGGREGMSVLAGDTGAVSESRRRNSNNKQSITSKLNKPLGGILFGLIRLMMEQCCLYLWWMNWRENIMKTGLKNMFFKK